MLYNMQVCFVHIVKPFTVVFYKLLLFLVPATPSPFFQTQKSRKDTLLTPSIAYNFPHRTLQPPEPLPAKPKEVPAVLEMPQTPK